jgi:transcriptional regulator with XRE-family HTH domain
MRSGTALQAFLAAEHISQADLAREMCVTRQLINSWVRGRRQPRTASRRAIASAVSTILDRPVSAGVIFDQPTHALGRHTGQEVPA